MTDPGNDVFLEIESVNVLDLEPPSSISGVGAGTALLVGEFENGDFKTVIEPTGATDLVATLGELGYRYNGVPGNNPSARARKADGAIAEELWNGNAFVQLNGKKFKRLLCCRVDTSVGSVDLKRQAMLTGFAAFAYNLEPAQVLSLDIGVGTFTSATFSATAATYSSGSGTYPTLFVGGETLVLGYDGASNFTVTFLAADQTIGAVIARINLYAGFAFADNPSGTIVRFSAIRRGSNSQVRVVSASASVLTAMNIAVGTTTGTGNVGDVDAVTFQEVKQVVEAAFSAVASGVKVEQDSGGRLRLSKVYVADTDYVTVGPLTTVAALGFASGQQNSATGKAQLLSTAGTYPTLFAGGETLTLGYDDAVNFTVTFAVGDQTQAQVIAKINAAAGFAFASSFSATKLLFTGVANAGQARVVGASAGAVLTTLGLVSGTTFTAAGVNAGTLPAGTQVTNSAATASFVTMKDVAVTVATTSTYSAKVRHALDDGTGTSATAGTITAITYAPDLGSFSVVNPSTLTAALTEAQLDIAYSDAIDATLDLNTVAREANMIWAARQSNVVRRKIRTNVIDASSIGMFGRVGPIRPPMGTLKATAKSRVAEPGVGAYRDQRVIYCYPQASTFVPLIARRGTAGGKGFNATGIVDAGADGFLCSVMSQLNPEENPGQLTDFTSGIVGLESSANVQGFTIDDYKLFKASGICALRMDEGVAVFQSGVTSVDPATFPSLKNIARRRMADYIQDTLARRTKAFGKKLSTDVRRRAVATEIRDFLSGLLSKNNPGAQRIAGYTVDKTTGNTPATLGQGLYRIIVNVRTLASLDAIVLQTTIGETVEVDELLPQAA